MGTAEDEQVEKQKAPGEIHRVRLEFEAGYGAKLTLIHPVGGCQVATQCSGCGITVGDPDFPGCEFCPPADGEECWLTGWVDELPPDEMLAGSVEFAVTPECDGESLTLHVAAEPPSTQQPQPKGAQ
jgi:hypothetical protein